VLRDSHGATATPHVPDVPGVGRHDFKNTVAAANKMQQGRYVADAKHNDISSVHQRFNGEP
jgi:hypothetical protein